MSKYLRNHFLRSRVYRYKILSVVVSKVIKHLITELSKLNLNRLRIENRKEP